jgi:predicted small secreted protein
MRALLVIGLVLGSALLASCSSTGAHIGDNLPEGLNPSL